MNGSEPRPNDATLVTIAAATVADAAVAALRAAADERDLAQEVRGIDSLPEREIQPVLATGFEAAGLQRTTTYVAAQNDGIPGDVLVGVYDAQFPPPPTADGDEDECTTSTRFDNRPR